MSLKKNIVLVWCIIVMKHMPLHAAMASGMEDAVVDRGQSHVESSSTFPAVDRMHWLAQDHRHVLQALKTADDKETAHLLMRNGILDRMNNDALQGETPELKDLFADHNGAYYNDSIENQNSYMFQRPTSVMFKKIDHFQNVLDRAHNEFKKPILERSSEGNSDHVKKHLAALEERHAERLHKLDQLRDHLITLNDVRRYCKPVDYEHEIRGLEKVLQKMKSGNQEVNQVVLKLFGLRKTIRVPGVAIDNPQAFKYSNDFYTQTQLDQGYETLKSMVRGYMEKEKQKLLTQEAERKYSIMQEHGDSSIHLLYDQDPVLIDINKKLVEQGEQERSLLKVFGEMYNELSKSLANRQSVGLSAKQEQSSVRKPAEQPKQFGVAKTLDEQKEELPKKEDVKVEPLPKVYQDPVAPVVSVAPKMIQDESDPLWNVNFEDIWKDIDRGDWQSFSTKLLQLDPTLDYKNYKVKYEELAERLKKERHRLKHKIKEDGDKKVLNDQEVASRLKQIQKQYEDQASNLKTIKYRIDTITSDYAELYKEYEDIAKDFRAAPGSQPKQDNLNKVVEWFGFKDGTGFGKDTIPQLQEFLTDKYMQYKKQLDRYKDLLIFLPPDFYKRNPNSMKWLMSSVDGQLQRLAEWYEIINNKLSSMNEGMTSPRLVGKNVNLNGIPWRINYVKRETT